MVVHGGGFTVEEQELDRRQLLSDQLKLARQLRGVMERAAETAKTLSPPNARDFYLELEPEICQLVSLTKAVRGEYTLDHYHQYDLDTTTTTMASQGTTTTNSSNNYNPPFPTTTTMNGHSPRNNHNNNNDKLMSAIHVIKEQLKDMAYERNPSLFPERKIRRKQITTKKITPTTNTNVGNNNNNGLSSKKKKNRTFKPSQTCLKDTTDTNDDANDNDADDTNNMVHPTSIHHNGKEKEEKSHHTNITNTTNISSEQRNSKRTHISFRQYNH